MPVTNRYFVAPTSGNDTVAGVADGRDVLGLSLVNATFDLTGGANELQLTSTGSFSGYTFTVGDTIYLINGAGIDDGLYEISDKIDANIITLVADGGLADSTGDVDSSDGPWKSTQFARNQVSTTGSDIYLCNEAVELINAMLDMDTNAGTGTAPIRALAATALGIHDGTEKYTIKAGATFPGTTKLMGNSGASNIVFVEWHDVIFDAAAESGGTDATFIFDNTLDNRADDQSYFRCTVKNGSAGGIRNRDDNLWMFDCDVFDNGGQGAGGHINNRGSNHRYHRCRIHDNAGNGIFVGQSGIEVIGCEIYDNDLIGMSASLAASGGTLIGNTIYGNDGDNVQILSTGGRWVVWGNTNAQSGVVGFDISNLNFLVYMDYNHTYNNTSGATSLTDGMPGFNNQTGDPQFANVADGSEDFTPADGSPLDSNNLMGVDIGARKATDPVGGGTTELVVLV